jgi:hypothetical protein
MAEDPRRAAVAAHVTSIARRTDREALRLTSAIARRCWPGGGDRAEPAAAAWLRRWRPSPGGGAHTVPACTCAGGPCLVCN